MLHCGYVYSKPVRAESFAICAARLAGVAGAVLGWRPEEFWAATPAELCCHGQSRSPVCADLLAFIGTFVPRLEGWPRETPDGTPHDSEPVMGLH